MSEQEALAGRLRALLIDVAGQLPEVTAELVDELIDANETDIALDMMSEMLVDSRARLTVEFLDNVAALSRVLGLGPQTTDRLRPLVESK